MTIKDKSLFTGAFPAEGIPQQELLAFMEAQKTGDADWKSGKMWSLVYHINTSHQQLIKDAHSMFISENYVNPMVFKSLKNMEDEVISMTVNMLNGSAESVGCMTSGGTESIFLAVYTAREYSKKHKNWIKQPEIIAPITIHPAFDKACHFLGIKLIKTATTADYQADVEAMAQKVNRNTILLAASAPHYPHGILDPIESIGMLAQRHSLLFHVDACMGGFILPWVEQLGYPIKPFDFRVAGVSSISADIHKFGYGAKGASVLLFKNMNLMRHQFFVASDWPGGLFVTTGFQGSKSGGAIAAAFAALKGLGQAGYLQATREIMAGAKRLRAGIKEIPELQILGNPCISITAFNSREKTCDIYLVADYLTQKGWLVDRQQAPKCIHTTVMPHHIAILEGYIQDLKDAVTLAKENSELLHEGEVAVYGLMADLPMRSMVKKEVRKVYEEMYRRGTHMSDGTTQTENAPMVLAPWQKWISRILRFFQ